MRSRERLATAAAVLFWLAVWQTAAAVLEGRTGTTLLLPYPAKALARLLELVREQDFWLAVGHSVGRIFSGYAAGVVLGCAIGIASAFLWPVRVLLRPLLGVIRATPVASFVIVALVWIRGGQLSAFIACLMVLPIIAENVETGLRETDPALLEMAAVFQGQAVAARLGLHSVGFGSYRFGSGFRHSGCPLLRNSVYTHTICGRKENYDCDGCSITSNNSRATSFPLGSSTASTRTLTGRLPKVISITSPTLTA